MRRLIAAAVVAALLVTPVLAGVYVDYDPSADLDSYRTFAWIDTPGTSLEYHNGLMHSRVKNYIEHLLTESGLVEDTENPDLNVTYHASSESEMSLDTTAFGYGWGVGFVWDPYWHGMWGMPGGMYAGSTTIRSYDVGTLIIDIVDAEKNELVWRGSATGIMVPEDPAKLQKKIKKNIDKMVKKWDRMKPGN
jgi:hypothetical protein